VPAARSASRCRSVAWEPSAFETRMSPTSIRFSLSHLYGRLRDSG
jgi:hypothetical protein